MANENPITAHWQECNGGRFPVWILKKGPIQLGDATLAFLSTERVSEPAFVTRHGIAVYLHWGIHPAQLTRTKLYDTAVPIDPVTKKYPHSGDAITIYESEDFEPGVVSNTMVCQVARGWVEDAIRAEMEAHS
jgi:hypothetical protein